jgi:broad specificity phosphatase PhoE/ribonuclease HI
VTDPAPTPGPPSTAGPASTGWVIVEADGGSRGNPGNAGYGAVVLDAQTGEVLAERAAGLGITTNNVAEYSGLIAGLEAAGSLDARRVDVRMDSKLVIEQCSGRWQVKQPHLRPLVARAKELLAGFEATSLQWIPRAENKVADALANAAMDGHTITRDHRPAESVSKASVSESHSAGWRGPGPRPTTTVLVRHASSVLSPQRRFSGRGDVPLSAEGLAQAEKVAVRLGTRPGIDLVVSSPLLRTRQTAELIAKAAGVDLVFDDDLVETDFGAWEGLTFAEAREIDPEALDAWLASPDIAPPGGESFADVAARVTRARDRLVAAHPERTLVVVSHVTPLKTLLRLALEAPPVMLYRLQLDVTGVSEVDWYPDGPANVRLVNDTHHL